MRLAALYILDHYLFNEPQTVNLTGKYTYTFSRKDKIINIKRKKNENYIDNLFPKGISDVSAIVGANGSGKTTIFSIINQENDLTKSIFIYEDGNDDLIVENRTGLLNEYGQVQEIGDLKIYFNKVELTPVKNLDLPVLYYSSIPDYDLEKFNSPISKTSHFKSTLYEYHLDNIERTLLLMSDPLAEKIKEVYPEVPVFTNLDIAPKPLYKRTLRNAFGGFKEEGEIEKIQKKSLDLLWDRYENTEKENLTHNSQNFFLDIEVNIFSYLVIDGTSILTPFNGEYELPFEDIINEEKGFHSKLRHLFFHKLAFVDRYIYLEVRESLKKNEDYLSLLEIFKSNNFDQEIKNVRKLLLDLIQVVMENESILSVEDIKVFLSEGLYPIIYGNLRTKEYKSLFTNLSRFVDVYIKGEIISEKDFIERFLSNLKEVEIKVKEEFDILLNERAQIINQLKDKARRAIRTFDSIDKLYSKLESILDKRGSQLKGGIISINLREVKYDELDELIQFYKRVIEELNINSVISAQILEFKPDKRFSFGEKSLIKLFSSLYEFTLDKYYHRRQKENYLLLLDEADLGFHPLWKKRYISAITKVIPEIFKKLNEGIDLSESPELKDRKVQIIFTTHDSLTLSDLPNYNITYLKLYDDKNHEYNRVLLEEQKPLRSFGANISQLLSDSFFIKGGLIGDFAREKIDLTIDWLNDLENKKGNEFHRTLIENIDEPIIKQKLREMFANKMGEDEEKASLISQIELLRNEYKNRFGEEI